MTKTSLRRDLLARRRAMEQETWRIASAAAQQRLADCEEFRQAGCVALYSPIQQEVDTELLFLEARSCGKRVLYPAVCGDLLLFREVTESGQRSVGSFGILEPCLSGELHTLEAADLIVVPGVAFDLQGHRIGFGKGYYDRCLSHLSRHSVLMGLCHDFQVVEKIPCEGHDIQMQYIVTDKRMIIPTGDESRNRPGAGLT